MNVPSKTLGKFAIAYEERKLIGVLEERVVPREAAVFATGH